jgi:hypothetical protein
MPALPVIAQTYRVALNWRTSGGQIAVNVIHIHTAAAGVNAVDIMENLDDSVGSNMWLGVSSSAVVTLVAITPLDGVTATSDFAPAVPAGWTGGSSGDFSPATAILVKETTALRGRSHRGRVYLPFAGEPAISDGTLDGTIAATMTTAWTGFQAAIAVDATTPMSICVASYKLATQIAVDTFNVEALVATQRRRQGRLRGA